MPVEKLKRLKHKILDKTRINDIIKNVNKRLPKTVGTCKFNYPTEVELS